MEKERYADLLELPGTAINIHTKESVSEKEPKYEFTILGEGSRSFSTLRKPIKESIEIQQGVMLERTSYLISPNTDKNNIPEYLLLNFDLCKSTNGEHLSNPDDLHLFEQYINDENVTDKKNCHLNVNQDSITISFPGNFDGHGKGSILKQASMKLNAQTEEDDLQASNSISLNFPTEEQLNQLFQTNQKGNTPVHSTS